MLSIMNEISDQVCGTEGEEKSRNQKLERFTYHRAELDERKHIFCVLLLQRQCAIRSVD